MSLTRIIVFLLVALLCCSSAQVSLTRISPDENDPICPETNLAYQCIATASFLIWTYTTDGGGTNSRNYGDSEKEGSVKMLGPFELVLKEIVKNGGVSIITSTANATNGLSLNDNGKVITCLGGTFEKNEGISFTVPTITSGSFCQDEVSWSHQASCHANCTVSVTGQDNATVPCVNDSVRIGGADLNNKNVTIIASDSLGNIVYFPVAPVEVCPASSTQASTTQLPLPTMTSTLLHVPEASGNTAVVIGATVGSILAVLALVNILVATCFLLVYMWKEGQNCTMSHKKGRSICVEEGQNFNMHHENGRGTHMKEATKESLILEFKKKTNNCHEHPITHCVISPDAKYVATADTSPVVKLWEPDGQNELVCQKVLDHEKIEEELKYSEKRTKTSFKRILLLSLDWLKSGDEDLLLCLAYDNCVVVWNTTEHTVSMVYEPERKSSFLKGYSPARMICAACNYFGPTYALSFTSDIDEKPVVGCLKLKKMSWPNDQRSKILCEGGPVVSMSFSSEGKILVTGSTTGVLQVYNIHDRGVECLRSVQCNGSIWEIQFCSADEKNMCCLVDGKQIYFWSRSTKKSPTEMVNSIVCQSPLLPWLGGIAKHPVTKRNKLFGSFCANRYILVNSDGPKKVLYKVDYDCASKADSPLSDDPFSCLDCVTCGDTTTCVMAPTVPEEQGNHMLILFCLKYEPKEDMGKGYAGDDKARMSSRPEQDRKNLEPKKVPTHGDNTKPPTQPKEDMGKGYAGSDKAKVSSRPEQDRQNLELNKIPTHGDRATQGPTLPKDEVGTSV